MGVGGGAVSHSFKQLQGGPAPLVVRATLCDRCLELGPLELQHFDHHDRTAKFLVHRAFKERLVEYRELGLARADGLDEQLRPLGRGSRRRQGWRLLEAWSAGRALVSGPWCPGLGAWRRVERQEKGDQRALRDTASVHGGFFPNRRSRAITAVRYHRARSWQYPSLRQTWSCARIAPRT